MIELGKISLYSLYVQKSIYYSHFTSSVFISPLSMTATVFVEKKDKRSDFSNLAEFSLPFWQFSVVESLWRRFWMVNNNNTVAKSSSSEVSDDDDGDLASLLPSSVLQVSVLMTVCIISILHYLFIRYQRYRLILVDLQKQINKWNIWQATALLYNGSNSNIQGCRAVWVKQLRLTETNYLFRYHILRKFKNILNGM